MRHYLSKFISSMAAVALVLLLLSSMTPVASAEESGCGENLSWSLSAGTLTVSGSGAMTDFFESSMAPWYDLRDQIVRLVLPEGLTHVGSLAFYGCENLSAAVIPDSVESIGSYAFALCEGMELLDLGSGVKAIGESAFQECYALRAVTLPDGLTSLGPYAFYRCESLPAVTVPGSVTQLGDSAFGYCKSLICAEVRANITVLPDFLFYGCAQLVSVVIPDSTQALSAYVFEGCQQLSSVHFGGSQESLDSLQETLGTDIYATSNPPIKTPSAATAVENEDGTVTFDTTTVQPSEHFTGTSTVERTRKPGEATGGSYGLDIDITVDDPSGWEEATDFVTDRLEEYTQQVGLNGGTNTGVRVHVYLKGDTEVDPTFLEAVAGESVNITVTTENGSTWKLPPEKVSGGAYTLRYELPVGSQELNELLAVGDGFALKFYEDATVNAEVVIPLGPGYGYQQATLFQKIKKEWQQVQTVVCDKQGNAHFYLASVDKDIDYYIGMNLAAPQQEPLIPEELLSDYGNAENFAPMQYEITGRKSSWNMELGQVMRILAVVMVSVLVVVGVIMFIWNKQRLKNGYVPQWDDEDE